MIVELMENAPHVLFQQGNEEMVAETAIAACKTMDGLILLRQFEEEIIINAESVPDLCKLLKKLAGAKP